MESKAKKVKMQYSNDYYVELGHKIKDKVEGINNTMKLYNKSNTRDYITDQF